MQRCKLSVVVSMILVGCSDSGKAPISRDAATASPIVDRTPSPAEESMAAILVAEETLNVGTSLVVEGPSPSTQFVTVFEDDGDTGYFYGLDTTKKDNPIIDAMRIYNVNSITDRDKPSTVKIVWSSDGLKSALLINDYPHAAFDFQAKRGYCRTGFPPPDESWTGHSHDWDDSAIELFK